MDYALRHIFVNILFIQLFLFVSTGPIELSDISAETLSALLEFSIISYKIEKLELNIYKLVEEEQWQNLREQCKDIKLVLEEARRSKDISIKKRYYNKALAKLYALMVSNPTETISLDATALEIWITEILDRKIGDLILSPLVSVGGSFPPVVTSTNGPLSGTFIDSIPSDASTQMSIKAFRSSSPSDKFCMPIASDAPTKNPVVPIATDVSSKTTIEFNSSDAPSETFIGSIPSYTPFEATTALIPNDAPSETLVVPIANGAPFETTIEPIANYAPSETTIAPIANDALSETTIAPHPNVTLAEAISLPIPSDAPSKTPVMPIASDAPAETAIEPHPSDTLPKATTLPIPSDAPSEPQTPLIPVTSEALSKMPVVPTATNAPSEAIIELNPSAAPSETLIAPIPSPREATTGPILSQTQFETPIASGAAFEKPYEHFPSDSLCQTLIEPIPSDAPTDAPIAPVPRQPSPTASTPDEHALLMENEDYREVFQKILNSANMEIELLQKTVNDLMADEAYREFENLFETVNDLLATARANDSNIAEKRATIDRAYNMYFSFEQLMKWL